MSMLAVAPGKTVCRKPKGQYCRLHNPSPVNQNFSSIDDVFNKVDKEIVSQKKKNESFVKDPKRSGFFGPNDVRTLAANIPSKIEDHINLSTKNLEHLTDNERTALAGYSGFAAGICNSVLRGRNYSYYEYAPLWRDSEGPCDFYDREDLVDYMKTMDNILSTRQKESRIVYRGIPIYSSLHDEIGDAIGKKLRINDIEGLVKGLNKYYKPGKIFHNETYTSTSHSALIAAERTDNPGQTKRTQYDGEPEILGIMFEMKTNAGLDITGSVGMSYKREREVLLPRDTYFKVVNVYVKPETYDTVSGYDSLKEEPEKLHQKSFKKLAVVVQMVEVDDKGNEITHSRKHKPKTPVEKVIPQ